MNRFLRTKNCDDYTILIPIETITEVILYDKLNDRDDDTYTILIFAKDEPIAIAREDYDNVEFTRKRFGEIQRTLNNLS